MDFANTGHHTCFSVYKRSCDYLRVNINFFCYNNIITVKLGSFLSQTLISFTLQHSQFSKINGDFSQKKVTTAALLDVYNIYIYFDCMAVDSQCIFPPSKIVKLEIYYIICQ